MGLRLSKFFKKTYFIVSNQYWFRWRLGVRSQQAVVWLDVDLDQWRHVALLGNNE